MNPVKLYLDWLDAWCETPSMLNDAFADFGAMLGVTVYDVRMLSALLLAYVFGLFHQFIPDGSRRMHHLYNIIAGVFLCAWAYGPIMLNVYVLIFVVYALLRLDFRHIGMSRQTQSWVIFFLSFAYLLWEHHRSTTHGPSMACLHFTGTPMLLILRLCSISFDYARGTSDRASTPGTPVTETYETRIKAHGSYGRTKAPLDECPGPIEYLGFCMSYGSVIVGPYFTFSEYRTFTAGTRFLGMTRAVRRRVRLEAVLWGLLYMAWGCGCMALWVTFIPYDAILPSSPDHAAYLATPFIWRLVKYHLVSTEMLKAKYYSVWALSHGASTMSGSTFFGERTSGVARLWSRFSFRCAANYTWFHTQLPTNLKAMSTHWNAGVGFFLSAYVYDGVIKNRAVRAALPVAQARTLATVLTYATSAVWHGLAPAYYLFFLSAAAGTTIARRMRRSFRPRVEAHGRYAMMVYHVATTITSVLIVDTLLPIFYFLDLSRSWEYIKAVKAFPFVLFAIGIVLTLVVRPPRKEKVTKKTE